MKQKVFQLRVSLDGSEPEIWRRLWVPADFALCDLHLIIQVSFGWEMAHMYEFKKGQQTYGPCDDLDDMYEASNARDDSEVALSEILPRKGSRIQYLYDFGDGWLHEIVLELTLPFDENARYPTCRSGEREGPPEDIGGIGRYNHIVRCIENPKSVPKGEMIDNEEIEWLGEDFDPARFDLEQINEILEGLTEGCDDSLEDVYLDYDPDTDPDPEDWLDLDEYEQIDAVMAYHRRTEGDLLPDDGMRMHALIHSAVENQIGSKEPPITKKTLNRLTKKEKMDRHEAIHAIGAMLAEQMYDIMKEEKPFDEKKYTEQLERLNMASWRAYCELAERDFDS